MNGVFPKVRSIKKCGGELILSDPVTVRVENPKAEAAFAYFASLLKSLFGRETVRTEDEADVVISYAPLEREAYAVEIGDRIDITSAGLEGAVYGLSTLSQMIKSDGGELSASCCNISDAPFAEIRGLHAYLPARENIPAFKRIIDVMALLKMNTLILEIGGGMKYDKHPEINTAWEKLCHQLDYEFPGHGRYRALQGSDIYWKDSVHTELAGGSYLTKEEVADLVKHCRERGVEVIPEIQALSHSYYLSVPHPEIAEMKDDPFPDTYCPNDERSYQLYFEVAEEVLEVIKPQTVSIGHDEIRVLGWCDKCKGKSGAELVGKEINRLHEFYKQRGVRIAMWGESAQTFVDYNGREIGARDVSRVNRYGHHYHLPSTCRCLSSLPEDILMIDWFHSLGQDSEDCFDVRGMETVFGNFHGSQMSEWERRSKRSCFRGAEVSSWCVTDEYTFGRDGIFFEMAYSANMLWVDGYTDSDHGAVTDSAIEIAGYIRSVMRGEPSPVFLGRPSVAVYRGEEARATDHLGFSEARIPDERVRKALLSLGGELHGVPFDRGGIVIHTDVKAESLLFLHNAKCELKFAPSHLFRDKNDWAIGAYAVRYEDGSVELVSLYYGTELGYGGFSLGRHRRPTDAKGFEIDIEESGEGLCTPVYYTHDSEWLESLLYSTTPVLTEEGAAFAYEWRNPHPEKRIVSVKPINVPKDKENTAVLYGIVAL